MKVLGKLYVQVLIGVSLGIALGGFWPEVGVDLKPLGDAFIKLIKMVFAPIIFATVVLGIAKMENMKELGRVGARALIYFEVLSTFALVLGLVVVNLAQPGVGMNVDPATLDTKSIASYTSAAAAGSGTATHRTSSRPGGWRHWRQKEAIALMRRRRRICKVFTGTTAS